MRLLPPLIRYETVGLLRIYTVLTNPAEDGFSRQFNYGNLLRSYTKYFLSNLQITLLHPHPG